MGLADLSFLQRLFDVAGSLTDDADNESLAFGLGEIGANSALARDDADMEGFWVSMVVMHGVSAALDHVVTLRSAVGEAETVTVSAPWTLLRGALEPVSIALWVLAGSTRDRRRERALRVWMHDYEERRKWEQDAGQPQAVAPAKSARTRVADLRALSRRLGLREAQTSARLNYGDTVAEAAAEVGWDRTQARARWREAAAFAHGRTWPLLHLTSPEDAEFIRGGFALRLTLDESRLAELARLTGDIFDGAVDQFARLSDDDPD